MESTLLEYSQISNHLPTLIKVRKEKSKISKNKNRHPIMEI